MVIVLALSGASGEFMRKPVSRWNNADVMAWVGGLGNWATQNVSRKFSDEVCAKCCAGYVCMLLT